MFVQGFVFDTNGIPLVGANVFESDAGGEPVSNNGTTTDDFGTFKLPYDVDPNLRITASFVGLKPEVRDVASQINFLLEEDNVLPEINVTATPILLADDGHVNTPLVIAAIIGLAFLFYLIYHFFL